MKIYFVNGITVGGFVDGLKAFQHKKAAENFSKKQEEKELYSSIEITEFEIEDDLE